MPRTTTPLTTRPSLARRAFATIALAALAAVGATTTANAENPNEVPFEYGYFYGTFGESPNTLLFAGGTIEEFCGSDPETGPGLTTARIRERSDGSTDVRVNARNQPIHLYRADIDDIPQFLGENCAGIASGETAAPQPFASGTAKLKVRDRVFTDGRVEVFNSVRGKATGVDGTRYRVSGSADFEVVDGMPVGDPADFVSFRLRQLGN